MEPLVTNDLANDFDTIRGQLVDNFIKIQNNEDGFDSETIDSETIDYESIVSDAIGKLLSNKESKLYKAIFGNSQQLTDRINRIVLGTDHGSIRAVVEDMAQDENLRGEPGQPGEAGKSAYQVWLDSGHVGSEDDFFAAMKGSKGDTGSTGAAGKDGAMSSADVGNMVTDAMSTVQTGAPNLIPNSGSPINLSHWTASGTDGQRLALGPHAWWKNSTENLFVLFNDQLTECSAYSERVQVRAGHTYVAQFEGFSSDQVSNCDFWFLGRKYGSSQPFDVAQQLKMAFSIPKLNRIIVVFKVDANVDEGYLRFDNNGSKTAGTASALFFTNVKLAEENIASPWAPAPDDKVTDNHDGTVTINGQTYVPANDTKVQHTA